MRRFVLLAALLAATLAAASADASAAASTDAADILPFSSSTRLTASNDDDKYPALGIAAIALLAGLVIASALMLLAYLGVCCLRWTPTPGASIGLGAQPDPAKLRKLRWGSLALAALGLVLKVVALGMDQWTSLDLGRGFTAYYGLVEYRVRNQSATYAKVCPLMAGTERSMCHTMRASGAITLLAGIAASLVSVLLIIRLLRALSSSHIATSSELVKNWRLNGVAWTFAELCPLAWICSAHLVLLHFQDGESNSSVPQIGTSSYIALFAPLLEALAMYYSRAIVLNSEATGETAPLAAQAHFAVMANPAMAYQPPMMGQGHQASVAVVPQQYAVYAQPPQQYANAYPYPVQAAVVQPPPQYMPPQPR